MRLKKYITIEFATCSDASEIANISRKYIEYGLMWSYRPEKIVELIRNRSKNVVTARKGRELVGFGIMTYLEDQANLDLLAVKQPFQRRGIGTAIVRWLEKVANNAGAYNVFVQVRSANKQAINFYSALGYKKIEKRRAYYQGVEAAIIMAKNLRRMYAHDAYCNK
jgi:ribosomal-protein-alanine N-acetyltransferase